MGAVVGQELLDSGYLIAPVIPFAINILIPIGLDDILEECISFALRTHMMYKLAVTVQALDPPPMPHRLGFEGG
jgi:hypothetical protein